MSTRDTEDDLVAELLPAFIQEAQEQIAAFEHLLLQLEDAPDDHELLDALFRCAHTVKGSAGLFGLDRVVAFTHHVETLLDRLREGELALTPELSTLLLRSNDEIRRLVESRAEDDSAELLARQDQLVQGLAQASGSPPPERPRQVGRDGAGAAEAATQGWHLDVRFGTEVFRNGMDPLSILAYLADMGPLTDLHCEREAVPELEQLDPESCHLALNFGLETAAPREKIEHAFDFVQDDCQVELTAWTALAALDDDSDAGTPDDPSEAPRSAGTRLPTTAAAAPARTREGTAGPEDGGFIRVHANRLDEVINLLGELVIAGAGVSQLARQTRQRALIEANQQITRLIEGIRNSTLKLRMVPIGETFSRFRRVVRDTAAELGKDVVLEITGADTELDKAVVERIADPLMHLVRNGLDHGLESPAERVAAGKPAQGRLALRASHESGGILIVIEDDGRGIQREKVLARAWERGLVERGVRPPDDEIDRLIFEPGFSTAEQVTNLSGRGVGMDVVRSNIEALRGSIRIDSRPGAGTRMEIRLPLTLAIIDGFLVAVGGSRFIFPLETVDEVIASHSGITTTDARGRHCVDLRGGLLPVVDLRSLYALEDRHTERASIVVVRSGHRRYGVKVDALLGQHQTVIKPLGRLLRSLRGIAGSSILGTGEVALIVDVDALGQLAGATRSETHALRRPSTPSPTSALTAPQLTSQGDRS